MGNNKKKTKTNNASSIRPLSAALRKKAEEEINETPSKIESDLKLIKEWIKQQPHLHTVQPTDQWLISFLRGCKYNMEKTQRKIDMYYTLKVTVPEFYSNRDPFDPDIQKVLKAGVFLPLRKTAKPDSPRVCISRVAPITQVNMGLVDLIRVSLMIVEILLLEDDNFTIAGETVIADLQDMSFSLLWCWTPSLARKIAVCAEKALSVRLKSMHILNPPFGIGAALAIFKMFMAAKIKDRIHSHGKGDFEQLHSHIDKSILPKELGGTDGTMQDLIDHWKAKVESYRDWYMDTNSYSDESKRVQK